MRSTGGYERCQNGRVQRAGIPFRLRTVVRVLAGRGQWHLMLRITILAACLFALSSSCAWAQVADSTRPPNAADLAGVWAGALEHDGDRQPVALHLEAADSGRMVVKFSMPVVHLDKTEFGRPRLVVNGDSIRLGPFRLYYQPAGPTLSGTMPAGLVPVYEIPFVLRKVERFDAPARAAMPAPTAKPVWTYDAGAALWAGPTFEAGTVYVGAEDGMLHALDARSGSKRWVFRAGGKIRTRPTVSQRSVYVQADDGNLYKLDAATGAQRWRAKVVESPIERLPFDNPRSRFDRFGSDVVVSGGRLFVGTHEGKVLALDPRDGSRIWAFESGDAVLAAPAITNDRVVFGSYDHFVYALDLKSGRELWRRDTRGAVVSTPAIDGDRVIVGNRAYDLLGLDLSTGEVEWKRYIWMSWVESSPTLRDSVVYVGSSDAAAVFAVDARTGRPRWTADVHGWSWGQPAVSATRVYSGTSSQVGYLAQHAGGIVALDRGTGAVVWRYDSPAPASGPYGFPGSPALGAGLVFVGGLDGRLVAFRE